MTAAELWAIVERRGIAWANGEGPFPCNRCADGDALPMRLVCERCAHSARTHDVVPHETTAPTVAPSTQFSLF